MGGYDIIGDIHGHADKLHGLLDHLGWLPDNNGVHRHEDRDRQVVFVGDLIDRGPDQLEVLTTVRSMVEAGSALIVMGNHEFNAISYATEHPDHPNEFLRGHSVKNEAQHEAFLEIGDDERADWIEWFRALPLWLDLGGLRVVHACWHQPSIAVLESAFGGNRLPDSVVGLCRSDDR